MQSLRCLPLAALVLVVACGPTNGDDFVERMAHEHRDDSPETGAADRDTPASEGAAVTYARLGDAEISRLSGAPGRGRPLGGAGDP